MSGHNAYDDVAREAQRDYYESDADRLPYDDDRDYGIDLPDDRCELCGRLLSPHEGPVCARCFNQGDAGYARLSLLELLIAALCVLAGIAAIIINGIGLANYLGG